MDLLEKIGVTAVIAWVALAIFTLIGWFMNLFAIFGSINDEITTLMILRIVGLIVVPLGVLLGWFA